MIHGVLKCPPRGLEVVGSNFKVKNSRKRNFSDCYESENILYLTVRIPVSLYIFLIIMVALFWASKN